MAGRLKTALKRARKTMVYSRVRQYFPSAAPVFIDDRAELDSAPIIGIDWPSDVAKPRVGIIKDYGPCPRWTKYRRFLENNSFPHGFYDISLSDWIDQAEKYDVIVGFPSNEFGKLEEARHKILLLERHMRKQCYPNAQEVLLYENKNLEAFLAKIYFLPFAETHIFHQKAEALASVETLRYPLVSKINPGSGSMGVELVKSPKEARRVIEGSFSRRGRKVHVHYFRQKDYVYFQEFVPNDGYDLRIILVGDWAFGYYRKVPVGDFRASGMHSWEFRALPEEAIRIARRLNGSVKSPLLAVDMVRGPDGRYSIIEFSPICQLDSSGELRVNGIPGVYVIGDDGAIRFEEGRYWVAELSLREFLSRYYLPRILADRA